MAPTGGSITINGGAPSTQSLIVTLNSLNATETGSGLSRMRFSNNGSTWSGWQTYTSTRSGWNLSAYGGNTSAGLKRVYVQYRDLAGNTSASYSDTITYSPLAISTVSPGRGTLIGNDFVTITGSGFTPGMSVTFPGVAATSVSVSSPNKLTCYTPRHLTWQLVNVRVQVGSSTATKTNGYEYVGANVQATGNPRLGIPFPVTFNAPVDGNLAYVGAASFGPGAIPLSPHNPLPLSPDDLFFLTAENKIPSIFANIQGALNASGKGVCTVRVPNLPPVVGITFYMAFVTLDASKPIGIRTVSSNKSFRIQS